MSSLNMSIGKLNKRVKIGKFKEIKNDENIIVRNEFVQEFEVWSNLLIKTLTEKIVFSFIIRYNKKILKKINNTYVIKINEELFEIDTIENVDYENEFIRIKAKKYEKGGNK